jgi:hypothetical protein
MTLAYMAIGSTLANIVNLEALVTYPAHVLPGAVMPLLGASRSAVGTGAVRRDGLPSGAFLFDLMTAADWRTLVYYTIGSFTVASKQLYVSTITEEGFYSPFLCYVERPYPNEHYELTNGGFRQQVTIPLLSAVLQSVTKTGNYTVTTSDRLVYCNTAGGSITLTLPAASAVTANTVYSAQKTSASNNMVVQRAGADTVDLGTSITKTANNARVDLISNGVSAWTSITA